MAFHRSIVRIPRNDRRNNSINCCLCLILYIVFNLILADYWLIINGIVFGIILLGGGFLYFLKKMRMKILIIIAMMLNQKI